MAKVKVELESDVWMTIAKAIGYTAEVLQVGLKEHPDDMVMRKKVIDLRHAALIIALTVEGKWNVEIKNENEKG